MKTATTVRTRNIHLTATDGPFAETKEQLGEFLMIDDSNLNDAICIVAQFPATRFSSVESTR